MPRLATFWLSAFLFCASLAACGAGPGATVLPPLSADEQARYQKSPADPLLEVAPSGAEIAVEIDLARLRANPVVGELVAAIAEYRQDAAGFEAFRDADIILYCAYSVGSSDAESLFLVKSERLSDLAGAEAVGDGIVAIASPKTRQRVKKVASGAAPSLRSDRPFMEIRERAIPDGAPGSSLRVTANLGFDARMSLARLYNFENVPLSVSVWGDVVDDLAILALLGSESQAEAKGLAAAAKKLIERLAETPIARALVIGYLAKFVQYKQKGAAARLALVIAPRRLELLSKRLTKTFRSQAKPKEGEGEKAPKAQETPEPRAAETVPPAKKSDASADESANTKKKPDASRSPDQPSKPADLRLPVPFAPKKSL